MLRDYLIVALLIGVVGLGSALYVSSSRNDALQAKADTATASSEAYKVYAKEHAVVSTNKEIAREATEEAIDKHRDWADLPVPDDIADRLREHKPAK